jgi:hypothetical protein
LIALEHSRHTAFSPRLPSSVVVHAVQYTWPHRRSTARIVSPGVWREWQG